MLEVTMVVNLKIMVFESFCNEHGYGHNFFALRTPQQNEIVEKKNRTLKKMARPMLCENNLPK